MSKGILIGFGYALVYLAFMFVSIGVLSYVSEGVSNADIGLGMALCVILVFLGSFITIIAWSVLK